MKGEYLFFWDSDIIMYPKALEELINAVHRNNYDKLSIRVRFIRVNELGKS